MPRAAGSGGGRTAAALVVFLAGLALWWLLSDRYTLVSLLMAVGSAALVAWLNVERQALTDVLPATARLVPYTAWLLKEIVVANIQVARVILDPRLPIDPVLLRLPTPLASDVALTTLGNSITLTPGTITLEAEGSTLVVHALTRQAADGLAEGAMVRRVAHVWREGGA
jgi:multicomponent Na+:H+ antiporter subunit E